MIRKLRSLRREKRGVTVIEFGIIAPVMLLLIMGLCEFLYEYYVQTSLTGAVQKAGRDAGIEGAVTTTIDNKVVVAITPLVKNLTKDCSGNPASATWCSTRKSYDSFTEVGPEPFTDSNGNGVHDAKECFTDVNGNKNWDSDPGSTGQGSADEVALYTVSLTYPRLFPVAGMLGLSNVQTVSATTLLKNQPYTTQVATTDKTVCP